MKISTVTISIISFVIGIFFSFLAILCVEGIWDFNVNIIDFLMLIATIVLSILVLYLARDLNKKDIAKDIIRDSIINDVRELISLYKQNSTLFLELKKSQNKLEETRERIIMIFDKADLEIDSIKRELNEYFPGFWDKAGNNIVEITTPYYKWVTGEKLYDKNFNINREFIKEHETILNNTTSSLKLIIRNLIRCV